MTTVIETTIAQGFCAGCGLCAGMCPQEILRMDWNKYGEYNPVKTKECLTECGLCVRVCPFADGNDNEDGIGSKLYGSIRNIHHNPGTGYYLTVGGGRYPRNHNA
jgi:ferredoxin